MPRRERPHRGPRPPLPGARPELVRAPVLRPAAASGTCRSSTATTCSSCEGWNRQDDHRVLRRDPFGGLRTPGPPREHRSGVEPPRPPPCVGGRETDQGAGGLQPFGDGPRSRGGRRRVSPARDRPLPRRGPRGEGARARSSFSGQCTAEVAALDEFTRLMVEPPTPGFENAVFDTAPTGDDLRLLSLPEAWNSYLQGTHRRPVCGVAGVGRDGASLRHVPAGGAAELVL